MNNNKRASTAHNKQKEEARHFYELSSLHCVRPMTGRYAGFIVGESNEFLSHHAMRHCRSKTRKIIENIESIYI